jgi:SAM-dependent methyltransferase
VEIVMPATLEARPSSPVTPEPIMRLAAGFMAAKHLFAANELGLFEALADGPASLDALAARAGLTRRAARISADAMVALGLLERDDHTYRNGVVAATFLAGPGPADLRPMLRFWDRISYPAWSDLAEALGRGPREQIVDMDDERQRVASAGIEAALRGPAAALPRVVDLADHHRLLDVGGGTGSWSIAALDRHPHLTATVVDLAPVAALARERVIERGMEARMDVVARDVTTGELPPGHDVILLANLLHYWSPEQNRAVLDRCRRAAAPGALLLLADFWTDAGHIEPLQAALMAGEFAVHLEHGDVYSVDEVTDWLSATGWQVVDHRPLTGPQSLVVARVQT